ncbi:MAG TPA: large conductance mechanosensitive channel protein MscL [Acidimicrobiia bacterium]
MPPPIVQEERAVIKEFKDFINRGNLVDIAVAFVMGVAFAAVVSAFTERIVSPLIGMVFDLSGLQNVWTFGPLDPDTGVATGSVGAFVEAFVNFLIVALVMFLVVRSYNRAQDRMKSQEEQTAPASEPEDVVLLREIRDALNR